MYIVLNVCQFLTLFDRETEYLVLPVYVLTSEVGAEAKASKRSRVPYEGQGVSWRLTSMEWRSAEFIATECAVETILRKTRESLSHTRNRSIGVPCLKPL
jgi:hypothetical protein